MTYKTIKKLDAIAKAGVANMDAEIAVGYLTPESVKAAAAATKNPTRIEVIKTMIRRDLREARKAGFDGQLHRDLGNVVKSAEQFNYLANAIDALTKRRAWSDPSFRSVYESLFGVKSGRKTA